MKIICIANIIYALIIVFNFVILANQTNKFEEIAKQYKNFNKINMKILIKIKLIMEENLTADEKVQKIEKVIQFNNHTELE